MHNPWESLTLKTRRQTKKEHFFLNLIKLQSMIMIFLMCRGDNTAWSSSSINYFMGINIPGETKCKP